MVFHGIKMCAHGFSLCVHGFPWFVMFSFIDFVMAFHETAFQRTGFQRTGRSRLSIWRSRLFRSIGNGRSRLFRWDWAFPMNGFGSDG